MSISGSTVRRAAAGLVIIMAGATVLTVVRGQIAPALLPLVVGLLAAFAVRTVKDPFARNRHL